MPRRVLKTLLPRNSGIQVNACDVRNQRGYVLLTLMLFVALLAIGSLALVQNIEQQIKRDREEELIHRGVQYSRAVQHYFKKFGRYPGRMEDLESTNNIRFLRKRYKDPITGKDFKPLRMTDVQMSFASSPVSGAPGGGLPPGGLVNSAGGGPNTAVRQGAVADPTAEQASETVVPNGENDAGQPAQANAASPQAGSSNSPDQLSSQTFGGGGIVGVASTSKDKTIREFNKKDHYNQWQFIYDPTSDRGGLLMTPNQPPLKGAAGVNPPNGAPAPIAPNQNFGTGQQPGSTPMQPNPQPPDQ